MCFVSYLLGLLCFPISRARKPTQNEETNYSVQFCFDSHHRQVEMFSIHAKGDTDPEPNRSPVFVVIALHFHTDWAQEINRDVRIVLIPFIRFANVPSASVFFPPSCSNHHPNLETPNRMRTILPNAYIKKRVSFQFPSLVRSERCISFEVKTWNDFYTARVWRRKPNSKEQ